MIGPEVWGDGTARPPSEASKESLWLHMIIAGAMTLALVFVGTVSLKYVHTDERILRIANAPVAEKRIAQYGRVFVLTTADCVDAGLNLKEECRDRAIILPIQP